MNGQSIQLVGVSSGYTDDAEQVARINAGLPPATLKILLYHTPELAAPVSQEGFDLYLAGHTHGGQIAFPFYGAIFTASSTGRQYKAGLYDLGGPEHTRLYVTRGLGMEGGNTPRARLFARPEISVINLVPA